MVWVVCIFYIFSLLGLYLVRSELFLSLWFLWIVLICLRLGKFQVDGDIMWGILEYSSILAPGCVLPLARLLTQYLQPRGFTGEIHR